LAVRKAAALLVTAVTRPKPSVVKLLGQACAAAVGTGDGAARLTVAVPPDILTAIAFGVPATLVIGTAPGVAAVTLPQASVVIIGLARAVTAVPTWVNAISTAVVPVAVIGAVPVTEVTPAVGAVPGVIAITWPAALTVILCGNACAPVGNAGEIAVRLVAIEVVPVPVTGPVNDID
jgi:hypothetical protein